jgi:hypothetical protein
MPISHLMKLSIGKLKFLYLVCFKFFEIFFDKGLKFKSMMLPDVVLDQNTPENVRCSRPQR